MNHPDRLTRLAQDLAEKTHMSPIRLQFSCGLGGQWAVMVAIGNGMGVVPGSISNTPEAALEYCLRRWDERSQDNPFV